MGKGKELEGLDQEIEREWAEMLRRQALLERAAIGALTGLLANSKWVSKVGLAETTEWAIQYADDLVEGLEKRRDYETCKR
jgi:hypothetical protein